MTSQEDRASTTTSSCRSFRRYDGIAHDARAPAAGVENKGDDGNCVARRGPLPQRQRSLEKQQQRAREAVEAAGELRCRHRRRRQRPSTRSSTGGADILRSHSAATGTNGTRAVRPSWNLEFRVPASALLPVTTSVAAAETTSEGGQRRSQQLLLSATTSALWKHLYYARGLSTLPVHQILLLTARAEDDARTGPAANRVVVAASSANRVVPAETPLCRRGSRSSCNAKNSGRSRSERKRLDEVRDSLLEMDGAVRSILSSRDLEVSHVLVLLGTSWTRPKEVYHVDVSSQRISSDKLDRRDDDVVGNDATIRGGIISEAVVASAEPTAVVSSSAAARAEYEISTRFLRRIVRAELERPPRGGRPPSPASASPSDKLYIAFGVNIVKGDDQSDPIVSRRQRPQQQTTLPPPTAATAGARTGDYSANGAATIDCRRIGATGGSIWDNTHDIVVRHDLSLDQFIDRNRNLRRLGTVRLATSTTTPRSTGKNGAALPSDNPQRQDDRQKLLWISPRACVKGFRG